MIQTTIDDTDVGRFSVRPGILPHFRWHRSGRKTEFLVREESRRFSSELQNISDVGWSAGFIPKPAIFVMTLLDEISRDDETLMRALITSTSRAFVGSSDFLLVLSYVHVTGRRTECIHLNNTNSSSLSDAILCAHLLVCVCVCE